MSKGIPISEKHGVNPTMGVCFFCKEPTGEIGLLGKLPKDAEAPRYAILSYEPCPKCKELMDKSVTLIEVTKENPNKIAPICEDPEKAYPTGRFLIFQVDDCKKEDIGKRYCMYEDEFDKIRKSIKENEEHTNDKS